LRPAKPAARVGLDKPKPAEAVSTLVPKGKVPLVTNGLVQVGTLMQSSDCPGAEFGTPVRPCW